MGEQLFSKSHDDFSQRVDLKDPVIVGGNPILLNPEGGNQDLLPDFQLEAFRVGAKLSATKKLPLVVRFDHMGGVQQFLDGKSGGGRSPGIFKLSELRVDIVSEYTPIMKEFGIDATDVSCLFERNAALQITGKLNALSKKIDQETISSLLSFCSIEDQKRGHPTSCEGIFSGFMRHTEKIAKKCNVSKSAIALCFGVGSRTCEGKVQGGYLVHRKLQKIQKRSPTDVKLFYVDKTIDDSSKTVGV